MEGMPRFPFIAPDFKQPLSLLVECGFREQLNQYIRDHFNQDPREFSAAMDELLTMREQISHPAPSDEMAITMKRYYAQMLMLSNRFPLDGKHPEIVIPYSWADSLSDTPQCMQYTDVSFELANVLYNLAACHAQLAVGTPREKDGDIKRAFTHFGYAAYPLQVIRDEMNASNKYGSVDFDRDTISFYLNVLMAQAQECMVEKALVESRKPLIIARLTSHLHDVYARCKEHIDQSQLGDMIAGQKHKDWLRMCDMKAQVYGAICMLYLGMDAEEREKRGERLGYYKAAAGHVKAARAAAAKEKRIEYLETIAFVDDVVSAKESNAQKENDVIYHERIPKPEEIKLAEPLSMACAYSFNAMDRSVAGDDLFRSLLPPSVMKAASEYDEEKAKLIREVLEKVEAHRIELDQCLDRMDLARLSEYLKRPHGKDGANYSAGAWPNALLAANAYFSTEAKGAIPDLLEEIRKANASSHACDAVLSSVATRLDAIDMPELAADEGVQHIRREIEKLAASSMQAKTTNADLLKLIDGNSSSFQALALPQDELARIIAPEASVDYAATPEGAMLLRLWDKVCEMRAQREKFLAELKDDLNGDDINGKLLVERDMDCAALFETELRKHDKAMDNEAKKYNIRELLNKNLSAQGNIISALLDANADFADYRMAITEMATKRHNRMLDLVRASDEYWSVVKTVASGEAFYRDVAARAAKIEKAVEDIEAVFGDVKRAHEEKKAAQERKIKQELAEREVRAALDDFNIPQPPTLSPRRPPGGGGGGGGLPEAAPQRGDRRGRVGDYMAFYRAKMGGAGGGPPPPMPPPPPTVHVPPPPPHPHYVTPPSYPMAPLPSLATGGYGQPGSGAPSPAPSTVSNASYAPPTPHPPPPAHPTGYYQGGQPYHGGYHGYAPPPPPFPPGGGQYPMGQAPPPPQAMQPPPPPPPTMHTPQGPPVHEWQGRMPPTMAPSPQPPPPSSVPMTSFASVRPPPPQQPPVTTFPAGYGGQMYAPPQPSMMPPMTSIPSIPPFHQPLEPPRMVTSMGGPVPPPPSVPSSTASTTTVQAVVPGPPLPTPKLPSLAELSAQLRGTGEEQMGFPASPWHRGLSSSTMAALPPNMHGGPQSWQQQQMPPPPSTPAPPSIYQPPPPPLQPRMAHATPAPPLPPPPPQSNPTMDLLSDLFSGGNNGGPAPLHPAPVTTEHQVLTQRSTPISASISISGPPSTAPSNYIQAPPPPPPSVGGQESPVVRWEAAPTVRPAAAVMPIPQAPQPVTQSEAPRHQPFSNGDVIPNPQAAGNEASKCSLTSLLDAATFELGPGDAGRLAKRQLHASIRGTGERPSLDPNDPLNQLDPFWKGK